MKTQCEYGCIFDGDRLTGDCRVPWADDCAMNIRQYLKNYNIKRHD